MAGTTIPDQAGDILVLLPAIPAGVFILHSAIVRLVRSAPVGIVHTAIPRQTGEIAILAAAVLAVIRIALRTREELMFPFAIRMPRTTIGQQRPCVRISSPAVLAIHFAHGLISFVFDLIKFIYYSGKSI
jgi:hypothetical protein